MGIFFRIPIPANLKHLEAVTLVFTWYLHDIAVLMLMWSGSGGLGVWTRVGLKVLKVMNVESVVLVLVLFLLLLLLLQLLL